jgi:hypothetical protein
VPLATGTPPFVVNFFSESYRSDHRMSSSITDPCQWSRIHVKGKSAGETNLPGKVGDASFVGMNARRRRDYRVTMREGDRILINKGISKRVMIVARTEIPHSTDRIFVTRSGGKYTIGLKVWKSDYTWNEKNQMWVPKH